MIINFAQFTAKKNINKRIKEHINENEVSEDEQEIIKIHKQDIFNLYDCKSYDEAKKKFDKMIELIDEYPVIIQDILLNSISPYFKTYFNYLDNKKIEKTNNKIENYFLKTLPRHVKTIMKTFQGVLCRIWLRQENWGKYKKITN